MEHNNNQPATPDPEVPHNNGSASRDSFLSEDNSKEAPVTNNNGGPDHDDNLSPISDSELEDDRTNDTTDARPVTPIQEVDETAEKEPEKNDNEATRDSEPNAEDTNTGDVEMRDVSEESTTTEAKQDAESNVDQENNNVETETPASPAEPESSNAGPEPTEEEPMDVDETDKGKRTADETSQLNSEENSNSNTNISGTEDTGTTPEENQIEMANVNNSSAAEDSIVDNQATDALNDGTTEATEVTDVTEATEVVEEGEANENEKEGSKEKEDPPPPEEDTSEQNVQEIQIGVFKDVKLAAEQVISTAEYDKILEETRKNISKLKLNMN